MSEPKFKVGQTVRCINPTHPGENPFVVLDVWGGEENLYYPHSKSMWVEKDPHDKGFTGCRESELELVEGTE